MIHVVQGDCLETLRRLPDACLDACVTDPPYGLSAQPNVAEVLSRWLAGEDYEHRGGGFMGKTWDSFVPGPAIWREVFRVLKPGAHVLAFFGTRTYHLGAMAIALAGFEIRDMVAWMYGQGFPKSLNVAIAIDKAAGAMDHRGVRVTHHVGQGDAQPVSMPAHEPITDEAAAWDGWGTALKPALEPIVLARKPLAGTVADNVLRHGTGAINIGASRVGTDPGGWGGGGSALYAGGLSREGGDARPVAGRWPANVILDEAAGEALDEQTGAVPGQRGPLTGDEPSARTSTVFGKGNRRQASTPRGDTGGASRFFYCAKATRAEREAGLEAAGLPVRTGGELTDREDGSDGLNSPRAGAGRGGGRRNHHPTVKPVDLMRYLITLVTPPGGIVLDPFAGSGTTGVAAVRAGVRAVLCELGEDYCEIIRARVGAAEAQCHE